MTRRDRIQMPPRASSAGMWTAGQRVAVAIMVSAAAVTTVGLVIIGYAVWKWFA